MIAIEFVCYPSACLRAFGMGGEHDWVRPVALRLVAVILRKYRLPGSVNIVTSPLPYLSLLAPRVASILQGT